MKHEATASPAAAMRSDRLLAGALHVLGASLMFAMMGALVKEATAELPNAVVVFFRNALALVILVPFFLRAAGPATLKTRHFRRHLVRSLAGLGSMYLFFYTLGRLPLAEAVLLSYTSPIFIPLVARLWIGEPLSHVVYRAVFLGFAGVVLILRPGPGVLRPAALLGWLFWSETLSPLTGLGTLLVCGAGMLTAAHGHRQTGVPVPSAPGNLHALGRENGRKQNAGRHRLR